MFQSGEFHCSLALVILSAGFVIRDSHNTRKG